MKQRWSKLILRAVVLLLIAPVLGGLWLISTEAGLHWSFQYARSYLPGDIIIEKLEGSLLGSITATNLRYQQNQTQIEAAALKLEWLPVALLVGKFDISRLLVDSLNVIQTNAPTREGANNEDSTLPTIQLPWRIALKNLLVNNFSYTQADTHLVLKQIKLDATSLFDQVDIESLTLVGDSYSVSLKGSLKPEQRYAHKLDILWHARIAATELNGNGQITGTIDALNIQQQVHGPLALTLNADVHDLHKQLSWQAEANIISIEPGRLWPEWPGQLQGKLTSKGRLERGQLIADADISQLTGKLRGFPVSLHSQLRWHDSGLDITQFDLRSGTARVDAQGRIASSLKLDWTIAATHLSELYPQATGQLQARGKFGGTPAIPILQSTFNGKDLGLADYRIGSLDGSVGIDLFRWQHVNVTLAAQALAVNDYAIESLIVNAKPQRVQAKAVMDGISVGIELQGKVESQGWRGHIEKADIKSAYFNNWQLTSPAALSIHPQSVTLETLCWQSQDGQLCATLTREAAAWRARLEMNKLPLLLLDPWLPRDLKLEGVANATTELQFHAPDQLLGKTHIELLPGIVSYPLLEGEREQWAYHGGMINVMLTQQGLEANTEIALHNGDHFQAQVTLPDANLMALNSRSQRLQAKAELRLRDPGLAEAIIPEIQDLKGEVALMFSAAGTLAQPRLNGHGHLLNGSLRLPRLGLTIEQLSLKGQSDGFEKLNFHLEARSGEGKLDVDGFTLLDRSAGWPTTITVKGDAFEISRIPEARVAASPDLQLHLQHRTIKISGSVHIPYARLQPKDTTTAVSVSDDAVIIGGKEPIEEKWSIQTKVRLTLGERVNFYGFGFEGRFTGSLLLEDTPGQLTRATGEIGTQEGRYRAYGQNLTVEHGRLLYTGGPLTNPGLDLRAVRHVGNITTGLKVKGSLSHPQIELFSNPSMGQTDALAYLILGRPFETASGKEGSLMAKAALALSLSGGDRLARTLGERFGLDEMRVESSDTGEQASLVIGRYLSPRLYVGYGVGLIESFNTINIRYQISDKWQLKGESGEHHGADILYTIEK